MSAQKHTEGPWRSELRGIYASEDRCIAEVFSGACNSLSEADANGLLLAAAPDLLAALETTAGNIKSLAAAGKCNTYDTWLLVVEAAITKAKGKS